MAVSVLAQERLVYLPVPCLIADVEELSPNEKLFTLVLPDGTELGAQPGQFVQVSLPGYEEAPISICSSPTRTSSFQLAVRRTGALTAAIHKLRQGDEFGIRGPFGTFFDTEAMTGHDVLMIAGGRGLAPMRSLIQYCEDRSAAFGRVTVLYGANSPQDLLFKQDLEQWQRSNAFDLRVTVDNAPDGSCYDGQLGLITGLIPPLSIDPRWTIAVIVGPPVMYRFVIDALHKKGVADEQICVSLERYMRCGMGKCGHCTIDHLYCCIDGPVFWLNEIRDVHGALSNRR
ncbi:MAG: FAD/NAD(P)-binding protein [Candidatus Hydrogenedentes bacterium]|nr:FAD/NAD(P)-binding protein [Candidatus Hydrogenedentota bacterium]